MTQSEKYMRRALELARQGWGTTHPNPMVGAVIVDHGEIVAEGFHAKAGQAHAEKAAIANLQKPLSPDATIYVTLEPCSTAGRTGACTEAIIKQGIQRVVVGAVDPNPAHAARGLRVLEQSGVSVESGVLADECEDLNLIFNHHIVQNRPFFAVKTATTLDGRVATRTGHSQWITGQAARQDVMRWRRYFPAIAVGAGTVLADDPALTSRVDETIECPHRFIFDRSLRTLGDFSAQVYSDAYCERTILVTRREHEGDKRIAELARRGIASWCLPADDDVKFFSEFSKQCWAAGIVGVYCEGGPSLHSALLKAQQIDYLFSYQAPKMIADKEASVAWAGLQPNTMQETILLKHIKHAVFDMDTLTRGHLVYPDSGDADSSA